MWALLDSNFVEKLDIFSMCNHNIYHLLMSHYDAVQILCRWRGQISNCCVATYLSILCAKYYKNRLMFVKTTAKEKKVSVFFGHSSSGYSYTFCLPLSLYCHFCTNQSISTKIRVWSIFETPKQFSELSTIKNRALSFQCIYYLSYCDQPGVVPAVDFEK